MVTCLDHLQVDRDLSEVRTVVPGDLVVATLPVPLRPTPTR